MSGIPHCSWDADMLVVCALSFPLPWHGNALAGTFVPFSKPMTWRTQDITPMGSLDLVF